MKGKRLDERLVAEGLVETRSRAKALIMTGSVLVDDAPVDKAGTVDGASAAVARARERAAARVSLLAGRSLAARRAGGLRDPRCVQRRPAALRSRAPHPRRLRHAGREGRCVALRSSRQARAALAAGLPIVTTPVGGIPDIFEDGKNGILLHSVSSTGIAEAISKILSHREWRQQVSHCNEATAWATYEARIVTQKMITLYRQVASRTR